jgi:[acyl-carrier-protein] S-malonyltransferase
MRNIVFLFDGQGAFRPGVGKELCDRYSAAQEVIQRSSAVLGYDLTDYLWGEHAHQTSSRTRFAQPAIAAVSLAYAEVLRTFGLTARVALGHSLGEITAVVYSGIVSFEDGMRIIQKRGDVMERGGGHGSMMAVFNIGMHDLQELCASISDDIAEPVVIANINAPNQIVISGSEHGIQKVAQAVAKNRGRGIPLRVGGAWHSPFLKEAAKEFAAYIDRVPFTKPALPFYSVVEQKILDDPELIKTSLKNQMLAQVHWVRAIEKLTSQGCTTFLEIGPSKILKDLVFKIVPQAKVETTALFADLEELAHSVGA